MLKWHDLLRLPSPRLNPSPITERSGTPVPNEIRWAWRNRPPNPTHKSPNIATCLPIKYLVNTVTYKINLRVCIIVTLTWDQYNQICQTSPARSPCTIPYFCACWSYLGSWSCKGVMATVHSNDTHSTKVSEVPSPEGKGIQLLLKMFLPLYWSLLNQMHVCGYDLDCSIRIVLFQASPLVHWAIVTVRGSLSIEFFASHLAPQTDPN